MRFFLGTLGHTVNVQVVAGLDWCLYQLRFAFQDILVCDSGWLRIAVGAGHVCMSCMCKLPVNTGAAPVHTDFCECGLPCTSFACSLACHARLKRWYSMPQTPVVSITNKKQADGYVLALLCKFQKPNVKDHSFMHRTSTVVLRCCTATHALLSGHCLYTASVLQALHGPDLTLVQLCAHADAGILPVLWLPASSTYCLDAVFLHRFAGSALITAVVRSIAQFAAGPQLTHMHIRSRELINV